MTEKEKWLAASAKSCAKAPNKKNTRAYKKSTWVSEYVETIQQQREAARLRRDEGELENINDRLLYHIQQNEERIVILEEEELLFGTDNGRQIISAEGVIETLRAYVTQ